MNTQVAEEINLRMDDSAEESDIRQQSLAEWTENGSRIIMVSGGRWFSSFRLASAILLASATGCSTFVQKWAVSVFPAAGVDGKRFHGVFIVSLKRFFCPPCERPPSCSWPYQSFWRPAPPGRNILLYVHGSEMAY